MNNCTKNDRTRKYVEDDVFAWAVIGTLCGGVTLALRGSAPLVVAHVLSGKGYGPGRFALDPQDNRPHREC